jgi:predicted ester cyclase
MHASMEEIQTTVHDTIVERDCVCVRWSFTARHSGSGLGIPATGRTIHVTGISIIRIADGQVVEGWQNWDMLGMMEQIQGTGKAATYVAAS